MKIIRIYIHIWYIHKIIGKKFVITKKQRTNRLTPGKLSLLSDKNKEADH